jgi:phage tail-like protein
MTRAAASDPLHSFRFHARASGVVGVPGTLGTDVLQPEGTGEGFTATEAEAGFQAITTPEITLETAEYREGILTYTQKYPGVPSINDLTFSRGVTRYDTAFFNWILGAVEGNEYRADVTIFHVQRPARELSRDTSAGTVLDVSDEIAKRYIVRNGIPIRVKLAADLDANTSDISLGEIDVACERVDIERPS